MVEDIKANSTLSKNDATLDKQGFDTDTHNYEVFEMVSLSIWTIWTMMIFLMKIK
jgi:hypothetical protein